MTPQVIIGSVGELSRVLVERLAGVHTLALTGGSVATTFFPRLSRSGMDWSATYFFWADERAVPPDHEDSNFRVARELLLERVGAHTSQVYPMAPDGAPDIEKAALAYEDTLTRVLGRDGVLDCALLGVGPDGHVCSLFPGHPLLDETRRRVAGLIDSPKPPPRRLTLTLPFVATTRLVIVVALGAPKAGVIAEALRDPDSPLPVARLARQSRHCVFLLDRAAGSLRP